MAATVGLGRDVALHFALFKDESYSFGKGIVLFTNTYLALLALDV